MKKLSVLIIIFVFAMSAICLAAPSSSKSAPAPAPRPSVTQTAPAPSSPSAPAPSTGYKPSAPASSYSNTAPAPAAPQPVQQPSGGGFLRTVGMIGSGMLIGGLLGNMFGFGHSAMLTSLMGILFNIVILVGIFMAGRYLWSRLKASRTEARGRNEN